MILWKLQEEQHLARMMAAGFAVEDMCQRLNRHPGEVLQKIQELQSKAKEAVKQQEEWKPNGMQLLFIEACGTYNRMGEELKNLSEVLSAEVPDAELSSAIRLVLPKTTEQETDKLVKVLKRKCIIIPQVEIQKEEDKDGRAG